MHLNNSDQSSSLNSAAGIVFAALFTFIVGYTASRVFLSSDVSPSPTAAENIPVTPHQATLWNALGR